MFSNQYALRSLVANTRQNVNNKSVGSASPKPVTNMLSPKRSIIDQRRVRRLARINYRYSNSPIAVDENDNHSNSRPTSIFPLTHLGEQEGSFNGAVATTSSTSKIPTFQMLPLEVRNLIYEKLLPHNRVITLTQPEGTHRLTTFGPLSSTCRQLHQEIKAWYKPHEAHFGKTFYFGLILKNTVFQAVIDDEFRDREIDHRTDLEQILTPDPSPCRKWWYQSLKLLDRGKMRNIVIHLKTEDKENRRDNAAAIKWMRYLYNLESIEFVIGGDKGGWGQTMAKWKESIRIIQAAAVMCWIPVDKDNFVVLDMESKLRDENKQLPVVIVRNSCCVLVSYNKTVDGALAPPP